MSALGWFRYRWLHLEGLSLATPLTCEDPALTATPMTCEDPALDTILLPLLCSTPYRT
jgi:hypothetical protein